MNLRWVVPILAAAPLALPAIYAAFVQRGPMSFREELPYELLLSGHNPAAISIYAEQRQPQYPRALGVFTPAFDILHSFDVRMRWDYWHQDEPPTFDQPPDFTIE